MIKICFTPPQTIKQSNIGAQDTEMHKKTKVDSYKKKIRRILEKIEMLSNSPCLCMSTFIFVAD